MGSARPEVSIEEAQGILASSLGRPDLVPVRGDDGQIAAIFSITHQEVTYHLEFREPCMACGMTYERLFDSQFKALGIPARRIHQSGMHRDLVWTVYTQAEGTPLAHLPPEEFRASLPEAFEQILRIARVDVSEISGWGWFNEQKTAWDPSWLAHLGKIKDEEPGLFFGNWHHYFEDSFLDKGLFDLTHRTMMACLEGVETGRNLIHGSLSTWNVLIKDGRVTRLQDWQDARIGDTLLDAATLDFWPTGVDVSGLFQEYARSRGVEYPDFHKRIRAYKCYICLGSLIYFTKINDQRAYDSVAGIARGLVE